MKSLFFAIIIIAFSVHTSFAQSNRRHPTKGVVGIQAGVNVANMKVKSGDNSAMGNSRVGINAGIFIDIPTGDNFSFQPGLLLTSGGMKDNENVNIILTYVSVPLLAKYKVGNSGLSLFAGPQLSILAAAKGESSGNSTDIKSVCEDLDIAGILGTGFQVPGSNVVISAGYQWGLLNVFSNTPSGTTLKKTEWQRLPLDTGFDSFAISLITLPTAEISITHFL